MTWLKLFTWQIFLITLLNVDDIIIAKNDMIKIVHMTNLLNNAFKIKNLEDLTFFLD